MRAQSHVLEAQRHDEEPVIFQNQLMVEDTAMVLEMRQRHAMLYPAQVKFL